VGFNYVLPPPPIILHWDGSAWTQSAQPVPAGHLYAVSAISATDAWAVGDYGPVLPLAEHWDGTAWRRVRTPTPGSYHFLYGVAAAGTNDVWAVGDYKRQDGTVDPLALHWDGTRLRVVFAPSGAPGANVFEAVSVVSSTDVWAVGYQEFLGGQFQPLIEHWDGTRWSLVSAAPPPFGNDNVLYGVSAASSSDVWAVGYYGPTSGPHNPLIEHWDGTAWHLVEPPTMSGQNVLYSVSAASSTDVWTVGRHEPNLDFNRPLALHWDGTAWTVTRTPSVGLYSDFKAVTAIQATDVWAAGSYFDPVGHLRPLVQHSAGCVPESSLPHGG
jgi:hypothetical protein